MKSVNVTPKSTYETPEERAARQVLIVRQSSLGHALEYTATNKIKDEAEVLALANRFSDWVFQKEGINAVAKSVLEVSAGFFGDMEDDLP
jgi:ABC-type tungstate transport system permease subunit